MRLRMLPRAKHKKDSLKVVLVSYASRYALELVSYASRYALKLVSYSSRYALKLVSYKLCYALKLVSYELVSYASRYALKLVLYASLSTPCGLTTDIWENDPRKVRVQRDDPRSATSLVLKKPKMTFFKFGKIKVFSVIRRS
jgi:hypothetical protein